VGFASHWAAYQNPAFADGMKKFCDEVHQAGAVTIVQLTHLSAVWAPSPVVVVGPRTTRRTRWATRRSSST